jgi:hypothetical protein
MGRWKRKQGGVVYYIDDEGNMAWLEGTRDSAVEEANKELGRLLTKLLEMSSDGRKSG